MAAVVCNDMVLLGVASVGLAIPDTTKVSRSRYMAKRVLAVNPPKKKHKKEEDVGGEGR